jgi:hypothetical protein
MLTQADFEARLIANIDDFEILERYNAQDPIVLKFLRSLGAYLALFGQEFEISELEPFVKTRDRSIIADAQTRVFYLLGCQHSIFWRSLTDLQIVLR